MSQRNYTAAYDAIQACCPNQHEMKEFFEFMSKFEKAAESFSSISSNVKREVFQNIMSNDEKYSKFMKFDGPYGNIRRKEMFAEIAGNMRNVLAEIEDMLDSESTSKTVEVQNNAENSVNSTVKETNPYIQNLYLEKNSGTTLPEAKEAAERTTSSEALRSALRSAMSSQPTKNGQSQHI